MLRYALFFIISFFYFLEAKPLEIEVSANHAILINAKTGAVLFEKEADALAFPASTTKIATALFIVDKYQNTLDQIVTVKKGAVASITPQAKKDSGYRSPPHWLETDGTKMGIKPGEELPMRELLYGAMLVSGNDACNALAMFCSNDVTKFMQELNHYLTSIGCKNTTFLNPHGLHHPKHVTSARDLATMAKHGLSFPPFREIVGTVRHVVPRSNLEEERTLTQTNLLMRSGAHFDPRVIGIKTGTTQAAGSCLVTAACVDGRELIAVVLGCRSRADALKDTKLLLNAAFSQPLMRKVLLSPGPCHITKQVKGARGKLKTKVSTGLHYDYYEAEEEPVHVVVFWNSLKLPIIEGTEVGQLKVINSSGTELAEIPLLAAADLKRTVWLFFLLVAFCILLILYVAKRVYRF